MDTQQEFSFAGKPIVGAHVRHQDPDTSHLAAESFTEKRLSQTQADVYAYLVKHGEATDEQIYEGLRWKYHAESTARKRRTDLVELGLVFDTGRRTVNSNGSTVIIWAPRRKRL